MESLPTGLLIGLFFVLLLFSAFFSGSETALMSLNRYRLKHLADSGHRGARLAWRLLQEPDRLIGLILLGNNFVNILVTQLATFIGLRLFGSSGIAIATGILTLCLLIFAEVAPKTVGALHPERFAFPAAFVYVPLLRLTYPLVWLINLFANGLLRLMGVPVEGGSQHALSQDELRTVVSEASGLIHASHQQILLRVLDLEQVTVADVMVPRNEITGIDLDAPWDEVQEQLRQVTFTRLPVYRGDINQVVGYIHMRRIMYLMAQGELTPEAIEAHMKPPYFIPESTTVTQQLLNFKQEKRRHALVVDEYGDVMGLVTLEDILEEIVGEFTSSNVPSEDIHPQPDGSYIVDGGIGIRDLNRALDIELPTSGPRTLNGLILEYLESIPDPGTGLKINGYPMEVVKVSDNMVRSVRIFPQLRRDPAPAD